MVVLAPHREVAKALRVVRLATKMLLATDHTVVGLELLTTTRADKATVLPNCVLVKCLQGLKSRVTYITGVKPLSLVCFVPPH